MKSAIKLLLFALSVFLLNKNLQASNCIPYATTLTRQSEVDSFSINYHGCDMVEGFLIISGDDITNLNGLKSLKRIYGLRIDSNAVLSNFIGLDSLYYVSDFRIYNNKSLLSYQGLYNIDTIENLEITRNNSILNFQGLNNLKYLKYFVVSENNALVNLIGLDNLEMNYGSIYINSNASLLNFNGIPKVKNLGTFQINANPLLVDFTGMDNLVYLDWLVVHNNNSLINFKGLEGVHRVNNIYTTNNYMLKNFIGLQNIVRIESFFEIHDCNSLENFIGLEGLKYTTFFNVYRNSNLVDFTGLSNLDSIGLVTSIVENPKLKNLNGLQNLKVSSSIGYGTFNISSNNSLCSIDELNINLILNKADLHVTYNPNLSCCKVIGSILDNNFEISDKQVGLNAPGCNDTIEIRNTNVQNCCTTKFTFLKDTICQGETVIFDNKILTIAGTYYDTIVANGMDSIIILQLKVYNKSYQILTKNFCIGQSFTLSNGKIITTNGTFKDTIPNVCDSIIEYHLNFVNNITTSINAIVCKGKTYTLPKGRIVTVSGIYKDTLPSSFGCDSIITTNLTITNPIPFNNNVTICSGKTYTLPNGNIVKTSGIYRDTILQANTCDSIVITNLTVNTYLQSTQTISVCLGKSYMLPSGRNVNQTGIYKDTIQNINGCDSIITTNLTITNPIPFTNNISICDGQTYTLPNGNKISTAGIHNDTIKKQNTCDSIVITNLSVFPNVFDVSFNPIDTIDAGNSIELKPFYSNQNAVSWSWLPNTNLSCNTCENPTATPIQTIQYILNAKSMNGCEDTATTTVVVRQLEVYIPTAFSPNNDGVNDKLSVFATNPKVFSLRVYNRFGELVFESHDVNNKWNGTFNGHDCTVDSYSFVLEVTQFNNKQIHKQGSVLLVR